MMTSKAHEDMVKDILDRLSVEDETDAGYLEDVAEHGADAGFSGFTYTSECVEFYEAHSEVIWQMLREAADDFGYENAMAFVSTFNRSDMLDDEDSFKNLLAWYALEEISRQLVDGALDLGVYIDIPDES